MERVFIPDVPEGARVTIKVGEGCHPVQCLWLCLKAWLLKACLAVCEWLGTPCSQPPTCLFVCVACRSPAFQYPAESSTPPPLRDTR